VEFALLRSQSEGTPIAGLIIQEGSHVQQIICALTLGMAGGYAVQSLFAIMGWP
jgi:hypothetical protein